MITIPAIDIIEGNVVRLEEGKYESSKSYATSVPEQAKLYENNGFEWIHIVDLMGSKTGDISVKAILKEIKTSTSLKIEFGGGIRSAEDVESLLDIGIDRIIIGSLSIKDKILFEELINKFGSDKFIVAADVFNEEIKVKGWTESTNTKLSDHITYCKNFGLKIFLITDIAKDGMLKGPNFELYNKIQTTFTDINIIVSGGISDIKDVEKVNSNNFYGVVVGKAIYENKISLEELSKIGK